jgi:hypothetical protein
MRAVSLVTVAAALALVAAPSASAGSTGGEPTPASCIGAPVIDWTPAIRQGDPWLLHIVARYEAALIAALPACAPSDFPPAGDPSHGVPSGSPGLTPEQRANARG